MLNDFNCNCPVYPACGYTDLRRGIDGLATIVEQQFSLEPCTNALFLFCGRRTDKIKACTGRCRKNVRFKNKSIYELTCKFNTFSQADFFMPSFDGCG